METRLSKLLLEDWVIVRGKIKEIESGSEKNFWIQNQSHYLEPVISKKIIIGLEDERGLYKYYITIRDTLKSLLIGKEDVKYTYHFNGAPKEIKDLLDKS